MFKKKYKKIIQIRTLQIKNVLDLVLPDNIVNTNHILLELFHKNKQLGLNDRLEITDSIYDILRNLSLYKYLSNFSNIEQNICLSIISLLKNNNILEFDTYLNANQMECLNEALKKIPNLNIDIQYSVPDWISAYSTVIFNYKSLICSLNNRAKLDIRINPIRMNRKKLLNEIKKDFNLVENKDFDLTPYSPFGLRLNKNLNVKKWQQFIDGKIEIQDEGSQIISMLVDARQDDLIIDFCSGAGGKSLLIGSIMRSKGRIYAFDVSRRKILESKNRILKAGLRNVYLIKIEDENDEKINRFIGKANKVLVDVPCTGSGTLRRHPELKWIYNKNSIIKITDMQYKILESASRCVKEGGYLIYATCSIIPDENQFQIEKFIKNNKSFKVIDIQKIFNKFCDNLFFQGPYLELRPDIHNTDGFFIAILEKINY